MIKKKINLNLNLYSYGYSLNFLNLNIKKLNLINLINKHKHLDLDGIELPIDTLFNTTSDFKKFYYKFSNKYKFYICFDDITNINYKILDLLKEFRLKNIRVRMPQFNRTIYGGNKFLIKKYKKNLSEFKKFLLSYKKYFLDNGFYFCIENHQDLSSNDLNQLILELSDNFIGVNWDVGNSIACGETPEDFFNNSSKYIKNIHLKDYEIFYNGKTVKLNRVPFGQGFMKNINIDKFLNHNSSKSIELGAQISRKCYISNNKYWELYNFNNSKINKYLKFIDKFKSKIDNKSDYESNLNSKTIYKNEFSDFVSSYNYIRQLR